MFELQVDDTFDSAHALRGYKGSCENIHGHTWKIQISLKGDNLNSIGILHDFRDIREKLGSVVKYLDHKFLNDLEEFQEINPSSENIAKVFYHKLKKEIPAISKLTVWETPQTCASFSEE